MGRCIRKYPADKTADLERGVHVNQDNCGISIWFRCKDADALEHRVREAGAIVISPAQDGPFGRMVVIREPDGRNITFHSV